MDLEMNMSAPQEQFNDNQTQEKEDVENNKAKNGIRINFFIYCPFFEFSF